MKKYDVVALGELLIDFTQNGLSKQGNYLFEANPGGAPCNVLSMLSNLGRKTAFMGKVGNDFLGLHLKKVVEQVGIDTTHLYLDDSIPTTLAFVHTAEDGDRDFSFYRNPGADVMLTKKEVSEEIFQHTKVFHFGSLSLTHEGVREATQKALNLAKEHKCLISYDPNLRDPLWESMELAKKQIAYGMQFCDILKISDNEVLWFTGESDYDQAVAKLQMEYEIPLILLSLGKGGSRAYYGDMCVEVEAFLQDNTIETTGAGDTFCACVIHYCLEHGITQLEREQLTEMLTFANAAASIITTRKGALFVMPTKDEIQDLCNRENR